MARATHIALGSLLIRRVVHEYRFSNGFCEFDRVSETPPFRVFLEGGFETAFWDALETFFCAKSFQN
jgi:hypothetical protein